LTADSISQAIDDLQAAASAWNDIETSMESIANITYTVNTKPALATPATSPA
jgi:hypothetical protein